MQLVLLSMHMARRQRNDVGRAVVRRHETHRSTVSEWRSSEPLEAIPRGRVPVPSKGGRRRIGLSGDAVDQGVSQILRRRLVWFLMCRSRRRLMEVEGGQEGGSGAGVGGRKRGGAGGVRGMSDRWVALDVA